MKLRNKLFLIVGSLFLLAFGLSFFVEEYFVRSNLYEAEAQLKEEVELINEMKRKHFEQFLKSEVTKAQARIEGVLAKIGTYRNLRSGFAPLNKNKTHHTWLNTSSLKVTNPWIDFIQNLDDRSISASIVDSPDTRSTMRYVMVNDGILYCAIHRANGNVQGPYIGVKVDFQFASRLDLQTKSSYYALFTPETLLRFDPSKVVLNTLDVSLNFLNPFIRWVEKPARDSFAEPLLQKLQEAKRFLKNKIASSGGVSEWRIDAGKEIARFKEAHRWTTPSQYILKGILPQKKDPLLDKYFDETIDQYDQIGMTWGLSALIASGAFGYEPFGPTSPVGLGQIIEGQPAAEGLLSADVFLKKPYRPGDSCTDPRFRKGAVPSCLESRLEVIEIDQESVFLTNTLAMQADGRKGALTIGIGVQRFLSDIARAADSMTAFVSGGRIVQMATASGSKTTVLDHMSLPIDSMLKERQGIVRIGKTEYFFLHMQPYSYMDFHFFIFKPKAQEYELLNSITKSSKELIRTISDHVRIAGVVSLLVVLFILHLIARSITRPIAQLAKETELVGEGKLDEVEDPPKPKGRMDEIYTLYHSFYEMVQGLKEKEKVQGVLNKVVSKEIAQKALEEGVHLGGEEREATVLFGDIRSFTKLTENMPPQKVIELLNKCMTNVSAKIDEAGGVIDKFVGDEVMALFGVPFSQDDAVDRAVGAATEMSAMFTEWNAQRKQEGLPELFMGFGIHTGNVVAGNMGAENRLNYTVLGANVNLAARLCECAKPGEVIISKDTYDKLQGKDNYSVEEVHDLELKGFSHGFEVFKIKKK